MASIRSSTSYMTTTGRYSTEYLERDSVRALNKSLLTVLDYVKQIRKELLQITANQKRMLVVNQDWLNVIDSLDASVRSIKSSAIVQTIEHKRSRTS